MPVRVRVSPSAPSLEHLTMNAAVVEYPSEGCLQSSDFHIEELWPVAYGYCCLDEHYCLFAVFIAENLLLSIYSAFFSKLEGSF